MMTRLDYFLDNPDCLFMRNADVIKSSEAFFKQLWGEESMQSQLVIIDTSELSPDILETLTSVVSRLLFDQRKKLVGDNRRKKPIHLILDEAHRYIKKHYDYLLKENIFEKIAREGRKYSCYLMVSSQRPSNYQRRFFLSVQTSLFTECRMKRICTISKRYFLISQTISQIKLSSLFLARP